MAGDERYDSRVGARWKEPYYRREQKVQFYEDLAAQSLC